METKSDHVYLFLILLTHSGGLCYSLTPIWPIPTVTDDPIEFLLSDHSDNNLVCIHTERI